jgi:L-ascorbate metabolism protein UlaG (beta-lactamase superfamily)
MGSLGPIDVALMPIGGSGPVLGHTGAGAAVEALRLIRPKMVIPIHWGSLVAFGLQHRTWSYLSRPALDFVEGRRHHLPDIQGHVPAAWRIAGLLNE